MSIIRLLGILEIQYTESSRKCSLNRIDRIIRTDTHEGRASEPEDQAGDSQRKEKRKGKRHGSKMRASQKIPNKRQNQTGRKIAKETVALSFLWKHLFPSKRVIFFKTLQTS